MIGVAHTREVGFVCDNREPIVEHMNSTGAFGPSVSDKDYQPYGELSKLMSRVWIGFIVDQDPNSLRTQDSQAFWPVYDNGNPQNMVFDVGRSYPEPDTFRAEAISVLISSFAEYHR